MSQAVEVKSSGAKFVDLSSAGDERRLEGGPIARTPPPPVVSTPAPNPDLPNAAAVAMVSPAAKKPGTDAAGALAPSGVRPAQSSDDPVRDLLVQAVKLHAQVDAGLKKYALEIPTEVVGKVHESWSTWSNDWMTERAAVAAGRHSIFSSQIVAAGQSRTSGRQSASEGAVDAKLEQINRAPWHYLVLTKDEKAVAAVKTGLDGTVRELRAQRARVSGERAAAETAAKSSISFGLEGLDLDEQERQLSGGKIGGATAKALLEAIRGLRQAEQDEEAARRADELGYRDHPIVGPPERVRKAYEAAGAALRAAQTTYEAAWRACCKDRYLADQRGFHAKDALRHVDSQLAVAVAIDSELARIDALPSEATIESELLAPARELAKVVEEIELTAAASNGGENTERAAILSRILSKADTLLDAKISLVTAVPRDVHSTDSLPAWKKSLLQEQELRLSGASFAK